MIKIIFKSDIRTNRVAGYLEKARGSFNDWEVKFNQSSINKNISDSLQIKQTDQKKVQMVELRV